MEKSFQQILTVIITCFHFSLCFNNTKEFRRITSYSIIMLTLSQAGNIQILSNDFNYLPDLVYLNDTEITLSDKSYNFPNCTNLITLYWAQQLTNLSSIFRGCSSIATVEFSDFEKVIDISKMFYQCYSLREVNFGGLVTTSVKTMESLFYYCSNLESINLISFNTKKVQNMKNMFHTCSSLTSLDLSNFDTSSVITMNSMFYNCIELTTIDVSNFNTSSVTDISKMFRGCLKLLSIDISNFDTSKITDTRIFLKDVRI